MSITRTIWKAIDESGFLFDTQQRWTSSNYHAMWREFNRFAARNQRILDLGCATSGCVWRIWDGLDPQYIGVDLTFGYLQWGKRQHRDASMIRADIQALPLREFSFDFVCAFSVLHHLDDATVRALGEQLGKLLPPAARVLVAEPVFPLPCPHLSRSDRLSRFLLEHDRGHHIRPAAEYVSLLGDRLEILSAWNFIYGPHHFCGFELCSKGPA